VKAIVNGVGARAVIDTGAERTLGNLALRNALRARGRQTVEPHPTDVFGATLDIAHGESVGAFTVSLGEVSITHVPVTYGDFPIFDTWHMRERPALLIGMDVLGVADSLIFDFPQRQLLIKRAN
jgi:Aspartyl protease